MNKYTAMFGTITVLLLLYTVSSTLLLQRRINELGIRIDELTIVVNQRTVPALILDQLELRDYDYLPPLEDNPPCSSN